MIFDFSVRDHVDFIKNGMSFDLHNDYEVDRIEYSTANIFIAWKKLNELSTICLSFYDVDIFQLMTRDDNSGRELGILEYAGFIFREEEFFERKMIEFGEQAHDCCFVLGFEGGDIRVRSRRATLEFI